jgi:hypothetical protein
MALTLPFWRGSGAWSVGEWGVERGVVLIQPSALPSSLYTCSANAMKEGEKQPS